MAVYFRRLSIGWPDDYHQPEDHEGSWRIYSICENNSPRSCTTRADIRALEQNDAHAARAALTSLSMKAQTGLALHALFDEIQCHPAHEFKINDHDPSPTKIWRLWKGGKVRVYFIYLPPEKRLVVLKTAAKRVDKLSAGEKTAMKDIALEVLRTAQSHTFESREIK